MIDIEKQLYTVTRDGCTMQLRIHELTDQERHEIAARMRKAGEALRQHAEALNAELRRRMLAERQMHIAGGDDLEIPR